MRLAERRAEAIRRGSLERLLRETARARDRIDNLTDDALAELVRELLAARGRLVDGIAGPQTPFDQAHRGTLLAAVDTAIAEFRDRAVVVFTRTASPLADVLNRMAAVEQAVVGIRLPFDARVATDAVIAAQAEVVGEMIQNVSDSFRAQVRGDLSRALAGGATMQDFLRRTAATLNSPGPFGTTATRAEVILRTEFGRTLEIARDVQRDGLRAVGVRFRKRWIATTDDRTRPSHAALDGVEVGEEEDFDVGGWPAAFPLDPRLPPEESINCRCTVVTVPVEVPETPDVPPPPDPDGYR